MSVLARTPLLLRPSDEVLLSKDKAVGGVLYDANTRGTVRCGFRTPGAQRRSRQSPHSIGIEQQLHTPRLQWPTSLHGFILNA
jgi:hypothetical protein